MSDSSRVGRIAAWWNTEARPRYAYAVAAGLALALFITVYGPGYMFGTSPYWDMPTHDHRAYMMGYRYFLEEPWHWPIFVTHTMNVPYTKSIAFTDSIPAWAFVNKAVATIVPPWGTLTERAYLGLWYGLVFVLQACTGVAILRTLGKRSWGATIVTTVMFLAVPAWAFRFWHASLYAQFLLLWALLLYLRTPPDSEAPRRLRIVQVLQLSLTALINPYHTAMSLGVFVASLARARRWRSFVWLPVAFAGVGIAAWLAGYLQREAKLKMFGFEVASTNMLSFFLPRRSGWFGEAGWIDPTDYQYEGFAYLGIGFLILLALSLTRPRGVVAAARRHAFLVGIAAAAWLFALSSHVYFGKVSVLTYKVPSFLHWIADQFRSPGRFVWLPMYVLIIFLLSSGFRRFSAGWKQLMLPLLALLQIWDVTGDWKAFRSQTRRQGTHLDLPAWRSLIAAHDKVFVMPTHDCVFDGTPGIDWVASEIDYLTSDRALPINGVYSARPTRMCLTDEKQWPTSARDGTLYVFFPKARRLGYHFVNLGTPCVDFAFGRACSTNRTAIDAAIASGKFLPPAPPPTLAYGTKLELGAEASSPYLDGLWSWPEPHGRWSVSPVSRIMFRTTGEPPAGVALKMLASSVICGTRESQDVEIAINDTVIGSLHFDASSNDPSVVRTLTIPKPELLRATVIIVELRPRDSRALNTVKCNADDRRLGVLVKQLWFE